MKVFVASYEHPYGTDVRVYSTYEKAEAWRQAVADEWWDHETDIAKRPATPEALADAYFDRVGVRMGSNEFFSIEECEVL